MSQHRKICILGATGSVGRMALSVIEQQPEKNSVIAMTANNNDKELAALCRRHKPSYTALYDEQAARRLKKTLAGETITIGSGEEALIEAATHNDCCTVIAAIAGNCGAEVTMAAAKAGKRILLANKEALILCGPALLREATASGGEVLPIDSEHCGLFEILTDKRPYRSLWLTASGGALRDRPLSELPTVTAEEALHHPVWTMGKKITIDSATMMNKSLEILEAAILFNAAAENIKVVMHPQSIVHAFVEYADGGMTAQLSQPDMKLPIARMLNWPQETSIKNDHLDWEALSQLTFFPPDERRYPCLRLAYRALEKGGGAAVILSAANEAAVCRFLKGDILFTDIANINEYVLETCENSKSDNLAETTALANTAYRIANELKVSDIIPPL